MDIIIRKSYKNVKDFTLTDLPDLIVLTGENGTGKTQLLNYLYQASHLDNEGKYVNVTDSEASSYDIPEGDGLNQGLLEAYQ